MLVKLNIADDAAFRKTIEHKRLEQPASLLLCVTECLKYNGKLYKYQQLLWRQIRSFYIFLSTRPLHRHDSAKCVYSGKLTFKCLVALMSSRGKKGKSDLTIWSIDFLNHKIQAVKVSDWKLCSFIGCVYREAQPSAKGAGACLTWWAGVQMMLRRIEMMDGLKRCSAAAWRRWSGQFVPCV